MGIEDVVAIITGITGAVFGVSGWRASRKAHQLATQANDLSNSSNRIAEQANRLGQTANVLSIEANGISHRSLDLAQKAFDLDREPRIEIEHTREFNYQFEPPRPYFRVSAVNAGRASILATGLWSWNPTDRVELDITPSRIELDGNIKAFPCLLERGQVLNVYLDGPTLIRMANDFTPGARCVFQLFDEDGNRYPSRFPWTKESLISEIESISLDDFNKLIQERYLPKPKQNQ